MKRRLDMEISNASGASVFVLRGSEAEVDWETCETLAPRPIGSPAREKDLPVLMARLLLAVRDGRIQSQEAA
jgi:hypothetical protein